ncbi:hypothetical protein [Tichowtungia aerotolerans]|uniref:Uncharacterized protein n=1 Tax=Tichowtungia aerotolerans TaxID=2697043 RepID=A0A6P1MI38_9BACT|nr:hypothetical protein [Tichowtungia aerotolerans]QHI70705.1 hypothetical protein GT409_15075 [Tichowtungia aerotolerans]
MKKLLEIISYFALIAVVAAPVLFYMDKLDLDQNKFWMLIATIVWFASASFWIGTKKKGKA